MPYIIDGVTQDRPQRGQNNTLRGSLLARLGCEWCGAGGADYPVASYMRPMSTGWRLEAVWVCRECFDGLDSEKKACSRLNLFTHRVKVYEMLQEQEWRDSNA